MPHLERYVAEGVEPLVLPDREHGLRKIIDEACAPLGIELDIVAEIESLGSVKRATEAGIGSTILRAGAVAEDVAAKRLCTAVIDHRGMTRRLVRATQPRGLRRWRPRP